MAAKIPFRDISDCKSLVDLCHRQGSMPKERRVALDIVELREGVERQQEEIIWTSTHTMLADCLTKHLPDQKLLEEVLSSSKYRYDTL